MALGRDAVEMRCIWRRTAKSLKLVTIIQQRLLKEKKKNKNGVSVAAATTGLRRKQIKGLFGLGATSLDPILNPIMDPVLDSILGPVMDPVSIMELDPEIDVDVLKLYGSTPIYSSECLGSLVSCTEHAFDPLMSSLSRLASLIVT
jgi:hypothetical protein